MKSNSLPPVVRWEVSSATIIKLIVILFGAYLLFVLRDILLIILTAIVFASAIEPINQWFKRHQISRVYSVVIIYLVAAIVLFGVVYFFIPSVITQLQNLAVQYPSYVESLRLDSSTVDPSLFGIIKQEVFLDSLLDSLQSKTQTVLSSPGATLSAIFGGLLSFLMIVILSFYLSVQEDGVSNFLRIVTPRRYEKYVIDLWHRTRVKIGAWLQGQLVLSVIVGTFSFIGLWVIGIENALVLAILAGIFELIPLFGPILASIPAILIGFSTGGLQTGFLVAGLYFVIQQLENHVFHPVVVKKVVGVPAILVIIALLIGAKLAGFLGIILAVPLAAGLMELVADVEHRKSLEQI